MSSAWTGDKIVGGTSEGWKPDKSFCPSIDAIEFIKKMHGDAGFREMMKRLAESERKDREKMGYIDSNGVEHEHPDPGSLDDEVFERRRKRRRIEDMRMVNRMLETAIKKMDVLQVGDYTNAISPLKHKVMEARDALFDEIQKLENS